MPSTQMTADRTASVRLAQNQLPLSLDQLKQLVGLLGGAALSLLTLIWLIWNGNNPLSMRVASILPWIIYPIIVGWCVKAHDQFRFGKPSSLWLGAKRLALALSVGGLAYVFLILMIYGPSTAFSLLGLSLFGGVLVTGMHTYHAALLKHFVRTGQLAENVVIVGATPKAQDLIERNAKTRDLNIVGIFDDRLERSPTNIGGAPVLGRLDDLMAWPHLPDIDRVIVTITPDAKARVRQLVDRLRVLPNRVVLLLDLDGITPDTQTLAQIAHSPAAYVSGKPEDDRRALAKRFADLAFASLMLVAFSPVMLVLAIMIKLESPGPILFRQRRHGFNNQIIHVWKFRSMRDDPDAAVKMSAQTVADDPRVTKLGAFIRKTSLDELPQLFNVLMGTMSIVGPRPHAVGMTSEDTDVHAIVREYAHRHRVKPGITGWAQINGSRGPVPTRELVEERVRLDMEYINRASFWFDVYIMIMTAPVLLGDRTAQR